jgi:folate-binding protein YgfZ
MGDRTGIVLRGKDRVTWLNGLVTCDLAKRGPSEAAYGLIVEKKGRIMADFYAIPGADALALLVPVERRDTLMETLDHYLIMEDVELEAVDLHLYLIEGSTSVDADFKGALELLGKPGMAVASAAPLSIDVLTEEQWEAKRIEHGQPRFGVEVDATLYPQEASLEKLAVSFDKGCYLGQEVVYMLENRGHVKRKLVPLDVEGAEVLEKGAAVKTPEGAEVGDVKSSVVGPSSGKPVAIAMVKWAQTKPGTELRIGDRVARVR